MKKRILSLTLALTALSMIFACSDSNETIEPTTPPTAPNESLEPSTPVAKRGAYVLCNGYYNENNSAISYIDLNNGTVTLDMYSASNGERLGDSGQDFIIYGSKTYCTVSGSSKMVIMDKNCRVLRPFPILDNNGNPATPRHMVAHNGKVYITAYDGTVSRLDTTTMAIESKLRLGSIPEAITVANDKLYINMSGYGEGNIVAVVDIATFTLKDEIQVALNPYTTCFTGQDGYVYTICNGNYAGSPYISEEQWVYSTLQRIDPATEQVTSVCPATFASYYNNDMYIIYSEYYLPETLKCVKYNLENQTETSLIDIDQFKDDDGNICPNSITVDPVTGDIYVCCTPYGQNGVVKVFDNSGAYKTEYTVGYCPSKIIFTE